MGWKHSNIGSWSAKYSGRICCRMKRKDGVLFFSGFCSNSEVVLMDVFVVIVVDVVLVLVFVLVVVVVAVAVVVVVVVGVVVDVFVVVSRTSARVLQCSGPRIRLSGTNINRHMWHSVVWCNMSTRCLGTYCWCEPSCNVWRIIKPTHNEPDNHITPGGVSSSICYWMKMS